MVFDGPNGGRAASSANWMGLMIDARLTTDALGTLRDAIADQGFSFLAGDGTRRLLARDALADWTGFQASWDQLGLDKHMADGGRYRRRRHAAFSVCADGIRRKPHQPHYQSRDYNHLNGGIERWFEPITDVIAAHPALEAVLRFCVALFDPLTPAGTRPSAWHTEVHQFRIEPRADAPGLPTPEGIHRDGVDWVLVMLIRRENVSSGTTTIHDLAGDLLGSFTLQNPLDAALVDDSLVFHGVTPVLPVDPQRPAFRDVLVVTLRRP